jgi:hypothetical protein
MMSTRRSGRRKSRGAPGGGRRGKSLIIYGAIFFVIGLVITIGTYAAADSGGGGTYIISWGPMVGGFIAMIRGIIHVVADRRAMGQSAPLAPGAGYGTPVPGPGQPGYAAPGYAAPGSMGPGYTGPGFAAVPGFAAQAGSGTPGPGWFADPQDPAALRWWDGNAWTAHTQPAAYVNPAGPGQPASPGYSANPAN